MLSTGEKVMAKTVALLLFVLSGAFSLRGYSQTTYYSYQTGDWNAASTWTSDPSGTTQVGATVPGNGSNVIILSNRTVSISTNIATTTLSVSINSGAFLDLSTFSFTSGFSTLAGQGTLELASVNFPSVATNNLCASGGGTVEYYNAANFTLPAVSTYNNLTINTVSFIATQLSNITLNGNLNVVSGTFQINNNTSTTALVLTINGSVNVSSGATIAVGQGSTNTTTNPSGVAAGGSYPFINYYAQFHRVNIYGDFINNGTVRFTNLTYPVYNLFPPLGNAATSGAASVCFSGSTSNVITCNGQTDFYNLILNKADVSYQLTVTPSSYSNFRLFGANSAGYDLTSPSTTLANPNLQKALWIRTGTLVLAGTTVIPSLTEGTSATADYYLPENGLLNIDGPDVIVLGTADVYQDVNAAYGVSGGSGSVNGVVAGNTPAVYNSFYLFGQLQVNSGFFSTRESGGIITDNTAAGQLIINGGNVDTKQFLCLTGAGSAASFQQNGGNFFIRGRFQRTPLAYTSAANLLDTTTASLNTSRAMDGITTGYGSFGMDNSTNLFTMTAGIMTIYDVCDQSGQYAIEVYSSASNINVTGGTVKFIPTTGTVLADASDYLVSSLASFGNLLISRASGSAVVELNGAGSGYPLTVLDSVSLSSGSFNANGQNLTIGGNFTLYSGTTYTTGSNTTIFNGSGTQVFNINLATALSLNSLSISKSSGTTLNFDGTQKTVNVLGNFSLTLATMNDNGDAINVTGNVYNSGVHSGTGMITLNASATTQTIDGNGIFQNLELNNTNGAAAPVSLVNNCTVNGNLTFSQNNMFAIGTYNLTLNATAAIVKSGSSGANSYLEGAGNYGDGGVTKVFSTSSTAFTYPIGMAAGYTPASFTFTTNPTTYGSINVVPVNYEQPDVTVTGQSLNYFWRVTSSGFTMGSGQLTQGYTYLEANVQGTESSYVAADYTESTNTWAYGLTSDVNTATKVIGGVGEAGVFLKGVNFIDGDYTAGAPAAFGTPRTFYSIVTGNWETASTWSFTSNTGPANTAGATPGSQDIVIIGGGNYVTLTATASCATLEILSGSTLDIYTYTGSTFSVVKSNSGGNGLFRETCPVSGNISTFGFPTGDFTSFNENQGTTEFYDIDGTSGDLYILPSSVTSFGNLMITAKGGDNLILPNTSLVTVNGNMTCGGDNPDAWICMSWNTVPYYGNTTAYNPTIQKTVHVTGNVVVNTGTLEFMCDFEPQTLQVDGNLTVNANGWIDLVPSEYGTPQGAPVANAIIVGGSFINNSNTGSGGYVALQEGSYYCNLTFQGTTNASISGTCTSTTFYNLIVNKGTSTAPTLTCTLTGLTTPTDNWLTLQNGTFIYESAEDLPISTVTNFTIPSTAGLTINTPNNVFISRNPANNQTLFLNGQLTIQNGNVYVGPGGNNTNNTDIQYTGVGDASINVSGGNLYVTGMIRRPTTGGNGALNYTQSAGAVAIQGNNNVNFTNAKLEVLNSGSSFNMSGGTLTISSGSGTTFGDLYLRPASSNVTGGNIVFDNTVPNVTTSYSMDADITLYNLQVNSVSSSAVSTLNLMTSPLNLSSLTINSNSIFNSTNDNVTLSGNLNNNGTYNYGTNTTTFSGGSQSITGASVTNYYNLNVSPSGSLTPNSNFNVNNNLNITSGNFALNTYNASVLNGGSFVNNGNYTSDDVNGGVTMAGTTQQQVSGSGSFDRLVINNGSGAILESNISLQYDLVLTSGILDIQSYLLSLGVNSNIGGSPFSASKMIECDGVATSLGVDKLFNIVSSSNFTIPIGVSGKYTPLNLVNFTTTSIGSITINPINSYQPTVLDPTNVLQYYWNVTSSGISSFTGELDFYYVASDVKGGPESTYLAAWLEQPGDYWSQLLSVNTTSHYAPFTYTSAGNLTGYYTAGTDVAIPNEVPTYESNSNGNWSNNAIWTPVGSAPACPVGGPNGYNVIILNTVTTNVNYCTAFSTDITSTGVLLIASPTYGHNFGTVTGDPVLGTGTLYLEGPNMPAGNFTSFLSCTGGGTVEYGGTSNYTLVLNGITSFPNLTFLGTGTRTIPNSDLTICNNLIIEGPAVNNAVNNRHLTVEGSMQLLLGSFNSGTGTDATVTFAGSSAQTVGGTTGNFTGSNSFNNLEINNSSGLTIGAGGSINVNGNLLLTNGNITTSSTSTLTISNTSSAAVIPTGGSSSSYVNGPLTKLIINGSNFLFPLGDGNTKGHNFTVLSSTTGTSSWTAQFFTPNPTYSSLTSPIVVLDELEYWAVNSTAANTAQIEIGFDPQSNLNGTMTQNGIGDLRASQYTGGSWAALSTTTSGTNSTGDVLTTSAVTISTTPLDFTIGGISTTKPTATLSPGGTICGNAGIPVTFTSDLVSVSLNYTIDYNWNGVAQTPIVVTSLPFTLPTSTSGGTYQLTGYYYNNSSVHGAVDGTIITVYPSPTTANAGTSQTLCSVSDATLAGNTIQSGRGTGLWTILSGSGGYFPISDTMHNAQFNGVVGNSYTLEWTISSGTCISSSTTTITFAYVPEKPSNFTAAPINVCQGISGYVYSIPGVPTATTYNWSYSGTGGTFTGSGTSVSIGFSGTAGTGSNTISVTAENSCGTGSSRTVTVTVSPYSGGTWLGNVDFNWMNADNWSCSQLPTSATNVTIPGTAPNMPVISSSGAICNSLTIQNSATLTISGANTLNVYGSWTNNGKFYCTTGGTVSFDGTGAGLTIGGSGQSTFSNLTLSTSLTSDAYTLENTLDSVLTSLTLTKGRLTLNGNTLVINNSATTAIASTSGYIISETANGGNNKSIVQWNNLGTATGTYVIPFATVGGTSIPVTYQLTATGTAGSVSFSTYYANSPSACRPLPVEVTGPIPGDLGDYGDGSLYTAKRFWQIDRTAGNAGGTVTLTLNIDPVNDVPIAGSGTMILNHYNTGTNRWDVPYSTAAPWNSTGTSTSATVSNLTVFSPWAMTYASHALPVSLLDFNALLDCQKQVTDLSWSTASETNNNYFTVERSATADSIFSAVTTVPGAGTTSIEHTYAAIDPKPLGGMSYYRLKQTDFDGKYTYSAIVPVQNNGISIESVYPNPSNSGINIVSVLPANGTYILTMYDVIGQPVYTTQAQGKTGSNLFTITPSDLPPGMYMLRLSDVNGYTKTVNIVRE